MNDLPTEVVTYLFNHVDSLKTLVVLRGVSRCFRNILDQLCAPLSYRLGREHFVAFDEALLAVRLQRIPHESRPHYDLQTQAYSFIPSEVFLQAVQNGKPSPTGSPSIPKVSWVQECAAVMDMYLLALAWNSTTPEGHDDWSSVNEIIGFRAGIGDPNIPPYDRHEEWLDVCIQNFYRVCFRSTLCRGIIWEPIASASQRFGGTDERFRYHDRGTKPDILRHLRQFPIYRGAGEFDGYGHSLFRGFFDWLYSRSKLKDRSKWYESNSKLSTEERSQLALLQFSRVWGQPGCRDTNVNPRNVEGYVPVLCNPMYPSDIYPYQVYRPILRLSPWSAPQDIIESWVKHSVTTCTIAQEVQAHLSIAMPPLYEDDGFDGLGPFESLIVTEMKGRFNSASTFDIPPQLLGDDCGLLSLLVLTDL